MLRGGAALGARGSWPRLPDTITALLLDSLRFRAFPEVPATLARLRAAGLRLVVASNWDASLDACSTAWACSTLVDGVVNSAAARLRQARRAAARARARARGRRAERAVHVGDSFREDVGAALGAGVRPVLLARDGRAGEVERGVEMLTMPELHVIRSARRAAGSARRLAQK